MYSLNNFRLDFVDIQDEREEELCEKDTAVKRQAWKHVNDRAR